MGLEHWKPPLVWHFAREMKEHGELTSCEEVRPRHSENVIHAQRFMYENMNRV